LRLTSVAACASVMLAADAIRSHTASGTSLFSPVSMLTTRTETVQGLERKHVLWTAVSS
jgi:hypothetical protein